MTRLLSIAAIATGAVSAFVAIVVLGWWGGSRFGAWANYHSDLNIIRRMERDHYFEHRCLPGAIPYPTEIAGPNERWRCECCKAAGPTEDKIAHDPECHQEQFRRMRQWTSMQLTTKAKE